MMSLGLNLMCCGTRKGRAKGMLSGGLGGSVFHGHGSCVGAQEDPDFQVA